jgi:GNAT superfamily N-acetyltransferase
MWWRLTRSEFNEKKGDGNRASLKKIVASGEVPGLLAYARGLPVAWCSIGPRENYPVLARSRVLARVDDRPVWSVVCFFIAKPYRRKGLTLALLRAAITYAKKRGAVVVEGYPVEPRGGATADAFAFTGLSSTFRRAGFVEVARRSETRPIMRFFIR